MSNSTYEWGKNLGSIQFISISHFECCNQTHSVNKSQAIFGAHKSKAGARANERARKCYERRSTTKCEITYVCECVNKHAVRKISIFMCQNMHLFGECGLWPHSHRVFCRYEIFHTYALPIINYPHHHIRMYVWMCVFFIHYDFLRTANILGWTSRNENVLVVTKCAQALWITLPNTEKRDRNSVSDTYYMHSHYHIIWKFTNLFFSRFFVNVANKHVANSISFAAATHFCTTYLFGEY